MTPNAEASADTWSGDYLELVHACPYCGESSHSLAADGVEDWFFSNVPGAFEFNRCADCGSLWMGKRLAASHLPLAYSSYYTHTPAVTGAVRKGLKGYLQDCYVLQRYGGRTGFVTAAGAMFYRALARNRTHLDAKFRFAPPAPSRILDYGCGGGEYLRLMHDLGHDVTGVDFDPATLIALRNEGIEAFSVEEAEALEWTEVFDCITLSHVIEHVGDPAGLVKKLQGMLKPGGILYIEAPNAEAAGLDIFGRYWRGLEAPRHLAIPSRRGVQRILVEAGLAEEFWITRGWVRSLLWPLSLGAVPEGERATFEERCRAAPAETARNAEYLILVARKRGRK